MINSRSRRKPTYRQRMYALGEVNANLLSGLGSHLQSRLNDYASALQGTYEYTNKGRCMHARTYSKRLAFAGRELEKIEALLFMSRRYNKITDDQVREVNNYVRSLYQVAIRDNSYAQKHDIKGIGPRINSLEKIVKGKLRLSDNMQTQTNYNEVCTQHFIHEVARGCSYFGDVSKMPVIIERREGFDLVTPIIKEDSANNSPYESVVRLEESKPLQNNRSLVRSLWDKTKIGIAAISIAFAGPYTLNDSVKEDIDERKSYINKIVKTFSIMSAVQKYTTDK